MAKAKAEAPLRRDGQEDGHPEVCFDREQRRPYHLDGNGERVYHECPAGFAYDDDGRLQRLPEPAAE